MEANPPQTPVAPAEELRRAAARAGRLSDDQLLVECEVDVFVASGPGGQHRNKTESGVRLKHRPTGVVVTATERRSQHQNRGAALWRLREKLAAMSFRPKKRKKTQPSAGAKRRRLEEKRRQSEKKRARQGD